MGKVKEKPVKLPPGITIKVDLQSVPSKFRFDAALRVARLFHMEKEVNQKALATDPVLVLECDIKKDARIRFAFMLGVHTSLTYAGKPLSISIDFRYP